MKAWWGQRPEQVTQLGAKLAPWYVGWREPDGRRRKQSCGTGPAGKAAAKALAERLHIELSTGTYEGTDRRGATLGKFSADYLIRLRSRSRASTVVVAERTIALLRELLGDNRSMRAIGGAQLDEFVGERLRPVRMQDWSPVSRATVNKDLRVIKAMLRLAADRDVIPKVPRIEMLKVDDKAKTFLSVEHFLKLYEAARTADKPVVGNVRAADWWQGLLVFGFFTGWRIGQILALRRSDIDLAAGSAMTRAEDNKGGRDQVIALHPVIVQHLRPLVGSFADKVFPWPHARRDLWRVFGRLQEAAGLPKGGKNGHRFGFHDVRRGFATLNAGKLTAFQLQHLMQHKSLATTQAYIALGTPIMDATDRLVVPDRLLSGPEVG